MNRAHPATIRKSLLMAQAFAKGGIDFVPMPVLSEEDKAKWVEDVQRRLDEIEKEQECDTSFPPCSACTDAPLTCDCCGETFEDDPEPYVERKYEYRYDYADRFGLIHEYQKADAESDLLFEVDIFSFWRTGGYSDDFGNLFFTTRVNPYKINWKHRPHTNASMVKYGWAPPWVKREEVEQAVIGTFGGRFTFFKPNGQFEFIAYTD